MLLSANRNVTATRLNADAPNVSFPDFVDSITFRFFMFSRNFFGGCGNFCIFAGR